jgi:hypothetical protein
MRSRKTFFDRIQRARPNVPKHNAESSEGHGRESGFFDVTHKYKINDFGICGNVSTVFQLLCNLLGIHRKFRYYP